MAFCPGFVDCGRGSGRRRKERGKNKRRSETHFWILVQKYRPISYTEAQNSFNDRLIANLVQRASVKILLKIDQNSSITRRSYDKQEI